MRSFRVRGAAVVAVLTIGGALVACADEAPELVGYQLSPAPVVGDLSLPDVADGGAPARLSAEPGGLLIAFFGFTNCPDVCPTTMSSISTALEQIGDRAEGIDVAMITVDPERDTPEMLSAYVEHFVSGAKALRADDDTQLRTVANRFGVSYQVVTGDDGQIDVAHTSHTFVVDDTGTVILVWTFGVAVEDMVNDLNILRTQPSSAS